MRNPTENEIDKVFHAPVGPDPVQAHEYYLKTRELKGRRGGTVQLTSPRPRGSSSDPRTGKTRDQIAKDARAHQRKELSDRINRLSDRLNKLEALIKKREAEEKKADH